MPPTGTLHGDERHPPLAEGEHRSLQLLELSFRGAEIQTSVDTSMDVDVERRCPGRPGRENREDTKASNSGVPEFRAEVIDLENNGKNSPHRVPEPVDIEHVYVQNDPRAWTRKRKIFTLATISWASLIATMSVNIYNPGINDIQRELGTSSSLLSLSLALYVLLQGLIPLLWSALSEMRGRKFVYIVSLSIYMVGCGVAGAARTTGVLIGMRCVQAFGGAAVLTIGASTLADIFEPSERGTIVGIYYVAPLLGPALGPIAGGILTQFLSWRSTFYFLCIFVGFAIIALLFMKETWRKERSLVFQAALQRRRRSANRDTERQQQNENVGEILPTFKLEDTTLSWRDLNPVSPIVHILKQMNNICILTASSLFYGFTCSITYTSVRTLGKAPYNYDALKVGCVLLSYGVGSMAGSVLGGRWSDLVRARLKAKKNGKVASEDRLHSTKAMMCVLPPWVLAYAWMLQEKVNIAGIVVSLFFAGFASAWMYATSLAYIVDANTGRSSSAVASNSAFRGTMAFVAIEVAVPLQDSIGDGGLYTIWAGLLGGAALLIFVTILRGERWRESVQAKEDAKLEREDHRSPEGVVTEAGQAA